MTNFENLRNMNIDELANWIDNHGMFDGSPWLEWFDNNYCQKCEAIIGTVDGFNRQIEHKFSYCELEHKCKFFPDIEQEPTNEDIIKMWLEQEANNE